MQYALDWQPALGAVDCQAALRALDEATMMRQMPMPRAPIARFARLIFVAA